MRCFAVVIVLMALLAAGCGSTRQQAGIVEDMSYNPPTSIYNIMDSTALVYSDPLAGSPVNDNPFRWMAFLLHPVGQAFDYAVNRPLYKLASAFPYLFGFNAEDAMVDAQRR